ncbi:MAG: hypothetical protein H0X37_21250 [Herpetosiphonaceae bacterium]|nr:hypothetical protein [Herpetosiphonaceae bacterium]
MRSTAFPIGYRYPALITFVTILILTLSTPQHAFAIRTFGSGYCWTSEGAWASNTIQFRIDGSVPSSMYTAIRTSAQTWTNIGASSVTFSEQSSTNYVAYGLVDARYAAITYPGTYGQNPLTQVHTTLNSYFLWSTGGPSGAFDVQNITTHEFGHWLFLDDKNDSACSDETMYWSIPAGSTTSPIETKKRTLELPDINGAAYQYP